MNTQRQKILALLQQHKTGVNSYDLTFIHRIKQAPTRVNELKKIGYNIISQTNPNRSVTYMLLGRLQTPSVTTAPSLQPREEELIRVEHPNGRVTWETADYFMQKGLGI